MRRLLPIVSFLGAVFASAIVVAMIVGGRLSPNWTPYFDHVEVCGAQLCAFGIVPGVTSWTEARAILGNTANRKLLPVADNNAYNIAGRVDRTGFFLFGQATNQSGQSVPTHFELLVPSSPGLTAGALVARFGAPCLVILQYALDVPNLILYYPFGSATLGTFSTMNGVATTERPSLNLDDPVSLQNYDLDIFSGLATCADFNKLNLPGKLVWGGFRSLRIYSPNSP